MPRVKRVRRGGAEEKPWDRVLGRKLLVSTALTSKLIGVGGERLTPTPLPLFGIGDSEREEKISFLLGSLLPFSYSAKGNCHREIIVMYLRIKKDRMSHTCLIAKKKYVGLCAHESCLKIYNKMQTRMHKNGGWGQVPYGCILPHITFHVWYVEGEGAGGAVVRTTVQ